LAVERGRGGGEGVRTRDHLANVRTLLAFVRAGLVLLALGALIDKLGLIEGSTGAAVGLPVAIAGWLVAAVAAVRFLLQRRVIEGRERRSLAGWDLAVVALTGAAGVAVLFYISSGG
jgi:uncharacterized membrane protein YidH (DUF202 family)